MKESRYNNPVSIIFLGAFFGALKYYTYFCGVKRKKLQVMSTLQIGALNAEILRNLGIVAEDEGALQRVAKYLRRVVREITNDPTLIPRDEFFASLDRGEEEYRQGKTYRMLPGETLDEFLKRVG